MRSKTSVPTALVRNPSSAWNVNESCVAVPGDSTYSIVATPSTPVAMLAMLPWAGARSITSCSGSWFGSAHEILSTPTGPSSVDAGAVQVGACSVSRWNTCSADLR